jgi:hypothetical protein
MVAPEPGEPLLLYITSTAEAVSMELVAKRPDAKYQSGFMTLPPTPLLE